MSARAVAARIASKPAPPRLLPIDDARHELGKISRPRIYDLINAAELQSVMIGRRRFITSKSIDALIKRGSAPMQPPREAKRPRPAPVAPPPVPTPVEPPRTITRPVKAPPVLKPVKPPRAARQDVEALTTTCAERLAARRVAP